RFRLWNDQSRGLCLLTASMGDDAPTDSRRNPARRRRGRHDDALVERRNLLCRIYTKGTWRLGHTGRNATGIHAVGSGKRTRGILCSLCTKCRRTRGYRLEYERLAVHAVESHRNSPIRTCPIRTIFARGQVKNTADESSVLV